MESREGRFHPAGCLWQHHPQPRLGHRCKVCVRPLSFVSLVALEEVYPRGASTAYILELAFDDLCHTQAIVTRMWSLHHVITRSGQ